MKLTEEMIDVIKGTHKFSKDPWTSKFGIAYIGYCHKYQSHEDNRTTRMKADKLLRKDLKRSETYINKLLGSIDIPQNHFDVMCSLAYDIGNSAFKNSRFFIMYKKGLLDEAGSRIIDWSIIRDQLSLAMQYRRDIDYQIYTESNYTINRK